MGHVPSTGHADQSGRLSGTWPAAGARAPLDRGFIALHSDGIDEAARQIAAGLETLELDSQEAVRYLWARVAEDQGILALVWQELRTSGNRFVYQEMETGKLYTVERPAEWTDSEEKLFVEKMRGALLGNG